MSYVTADQSLPRSLDVTISLSRPQTETRTNLTRLCVACEDLGFLPNENRIRFYSSIEAVETDFAAGTEAHYAASAFFSQTPRAVQMALGEVFLDPQPALLVSAELTAADITALELISDGTLLIVYNPDTEDSGSGSAVSLEMTGLDFDGVTDIDGIAAILDAACDAGLSCSVKTLPGGDELLQFVTVATGDAVSITYAADQGTGTDVSALLNLTLATGGQVMNGYTPTGIADELASIANAANQLDEYIYAWCLGASLRDVDYQAAVATWALARTAVTALVTNDITALSASYDLDLGSVLNAEGNRRACAIYHDNVQAYPDVSILAYMLHVNYQLQDSTVTAKFKTLPGIETVQLTETEWAILKAKGYNTYTAIGNDARTFREGENESSGWFLDTVINLDNFVEDLSVNVFNVFLRNKKVPYTRRGQMMIADACTDTGYQYTYNGTFADREELDTTRKSGTIVTPAVQVLPTPISLMSAADRASRIGPPIEMICQEAGALHSIAINVGIVP